MPRINKTRRRTLLVEVVGEPVQALVETVTSGSASGLDEPSSVANLLEAELLSDLRDRHSLRQVHLVRED